MANNQIKGNLRPKRKMLQKTTINDFSVLKIIGKGAFGEVRTVKEKATGLVFAMKTMEKQLIIQKGRTQHVNTETGLMAEASGCHFLAQLIGSFQVRCLFSNVAFFGMVIFFVLWLCYNCALIHFVDFRAIVFRYNWLFALPVVLHCFFSFSFFFFCVFVV